LKELYAMRHAADKVGAIVVPGYTLRHYPGIKALQTGERYGKLLYMRALYGHGGGASGWRAEPAGGGELLDQCSHLIDLAQLMMDASSLEVVHAILPRIITKDVEDNAWLTLESDGVFASLHASWTEWRPTFSVVAMYERGRVRLSGLSGAYRDQEISFQNLQEVEERHLYAHTDVLRDEWEAFKTISRAEATMRMADAQRTLRLIEEARKCAFY
jgi:predicted dehydrogenase